MMSYTSAFFQTQMAGSRQSADRIAAIIVEQLHPKSVVDLGCGVGTWLAAFQRLGVERIEGYDGDYVDRELLQIPPGSFHPIDLSTALRNGEPGGEFDLAVSLEVGEHLPPAASEALVQRLTALAPAVLFSAAIPRQSGTDHINERWQSDWARMFAVHGYYPHDAVRPVVWDEPEVEPWYAQNALLYLREPSPAPMMLDLVHPRLWEKNLANSAVGVQVRNRLRQLFWSGVERIRGQRG
jgi:SAM-dependent methyltransferase